MKRLILIQIICFVIGALMMMKDGAYSWADTTWVGFTGQVIFIFGGIFLIPIASLVLWLTKDK